MRTHMCAKAHANKNRSLTYTYKRENGVIIQYIMLYITNIQILSVKIAYKLKRNHYEEFIVLAKKRTNK